MSVSGGAIAFDDSVPRLGALKALAAASVITPFLVLGAYAAISYQLGFRAAEARTAHLSGMLQEHSERACETISLALTDARNVLTGHSDAEIRGSKALWDKIVTIQSVGPQIGTIFVIGADGSDVLTTRGFPPPPVNFGDRDYFLAQKDQDVGVFLGTAYKGRLVDLPIFNFSIRRTNPDGSFAGVIGSSAAVSYFRDFYARAGDVDDDFSVALVRDDGAVLVRYPQFTFGDKLAVLLAANVSGKPNIRYAKSNIDGKDRIYATSKVGQFPAYVAYSISMQAVRRQWIEDLIAPGIATLLGAMALFALSFVAVRRAQREALATRELQEETGRREQAERSLMHAQKLDEIGRLTSGIAHDFNNLLTIILGNLALAKKRNGSAAIRLLRGAEDAAKRGAALTSQLLTFSRAQALHPRNIDVNQVLLEAKSWISRAITESVAIKLQLQPDSLPVYLDVAQLESALLNLVVNARDAMQGCGTLMIRSYVAHAPEGAPVSLEPGEYVAIAVSDTGVGIPDAVASKILQPFFTTKPAGKGTGLGLSQVHAFVRQSGGEIAIESKVGEGTTITLFFPRGTAIEKQIEHAKSDQSSERGGRAKVVLVVDDDPEVRHLTSEMLHEIGHVPLLARTSEEALALLSAQAHIDVLLADLVLPGEDGIALAAKVERLYPSIRIVFATALLEFNNAAQRVVLKKPYDEDELAAAIDQLYEGAMRASS